MANHVYGNHDWSRDLADMFMGAGKTAWQVITFGIGDDPNDQSGHDFSYAGGVGITPIARLNYSHHGQGTIPLPDRYDEFAQRCMNFVRNSVGCTHWLIGNEPNLAGERPGGVVIMPEQYARCFTQVWRRIFLLSNAPHKVIPAAVAPYNVDTGSWIDYWRVMLREIWANGGCEGLAVHTYSRGGDPASVFSEDKMDAPYQAYYNGFRAYRDFLGAVPAEMRHLPTYITETDQLEPWVDVNSGWVGNAYREISDWNRKAGTQKVWALCLYRWDKYDQWEFQSKNGVLEDLRHVVKTTNYGVPSPSPTTVPIPPTLVDKSGPFVVVVTSAGANLRRGPGKNYTVAGAVPVHHILKVVGKSADSEWWRVETEKWGLAWVHFSVVEAKNTEGVPVVHVALPPTTPVTTPVSPVVNEQWMTATWCRILGIDETVARAVLAVESGGRAFEGGRMVIRFENHLFHHNIERKAPGLLGVVIEHFRYGSPQWTGHEVLIPGRTEWEKQHDGGQAEEWVVFSYARSIHEECAMLSISMGMGQIIGSNYLLVGYASVEEMFADYNDLNMGKYNQLAGFFAYIVNRKDMLVAMRDKNWREIARLYNGAGNQDVYAPLLRNKYLELGGRD